MLQFKGICMALSNGFDAIRGELDDNENQFNVYAFEQISELSSEMGIDAASAQIGDRRGYLTIDLVDSNGSELGTVGLIDSRWGYASDRRTGNLNPADSAHGAIFGILNHHIDDGGLVG
jgi:hypothetical protein